MNPCENIALDIKEFTEMCTDMGIKMNINDVYYFIIILFILIIINKNI
jgi:hypothetical protein